MIPICITEGGILRAYRPGERTMERNIQYNKKLSKEDIDTLVYQAAFSTDEKDREKSRRTIMKSAYTMGIIPASIQGLYEASGKGLYKNKTVPAINVRGITYDTARCIFKVALKLNIGAFIFEIARTEAIYTDQKPAEYTTSVLAAAIREGFKGFVFIQADHTQVNAGKFKADPQKELNGIKDYIKEAVNGGFLNIDIDASTIVDLGKPTLEQQQANNCAITAMMTEYIRGIEPKGVTISIGGEIGEVGGKNSTVEDLKTFMTGYNNRLKPDIKGISKISVQTGTTHGGVVLPNGSIAHIDLDFKTLETLSTMSQKEYGLAGAVQHGASTLPQEAFGMFSQAGAAEVHLATGFQNITMDSKHFPKDLRDRMYAYLAKNHANERKAGETDEQFYYKTRKRAWGPFKKETWDIPEAKKQAIREELEAEFFMMFEKLNVANTVDLVNKYVPASSQFNWDF
jgi:fructose/tagatose bisphosphate aldolase